VGMMSRGGVGVMGMGASMYSPFGRSGGGGGGGAYDRYSGRGGGLDEDDRDRNYNSHTGLPPAKKIEALRAIKDGKELDTDNATDSDIDFSERVFKVGDYVDCQDSVNKWMVAQVVKVEDTRVEINFVGWASKWNEALDVANPRMRPLGSRVARDLVETTLKTAAAAATAAGL